MCRSTGQLHRDLHSTCSGLERHSLVRNWPERHKLEHRLGRRSSHTKACSTCRRDPAGLGSSLACSRPTLGSSLLRPEQHKREHRPEHKREQHNLEHRLDGNSRQEPHKREHKQRGLHKPDGNWRREPHRLVHRRPERSSQRELHKLQRELHKQAHRQRELHRPAHRLRHRDHSWQRELHKLERNPCCSWRPEHSNWPEHCSYRSRAA